MNRREFMQAAGVAGLVAAVPEFRPHAPRRPRLQRPKRGTKTAVDLVTPPMDRVRVGLIGVGARGSGHVVSLLHIGGVEVTAICDTHVPSAEASVQACVRAGRPKPAVFTEGDYAYRHMLERDDIDIVIIATPWEWHAKMAVDTMKAGKHAFIEVPAAVTVDECWDLVETSEATQRHCMMMENCCYGREELMVLNMVRQGVLGELLHGEGAYIHDLRDQMNETDHGTGSWRTLHYTRRNGNIYPTHGLGPVSQYMSINRGDRMDFLTSVSSNARVREIYAREHFPEGHARRKLKFICGDINTTVVRTVMGKTIMIQWDEQLPRPYSRLNLIQGTKGVWGGYPQRVVVEGISPTTEDWEQGDKLDAWYAKYEHPLWKRVGEEAVKNGGHGGMDFVMLWRMIYCLRNGLPLDQDVYDAATWSVISPLSEWSVANRGQSIDVPDFTRGQWSTMKPLGIVS